MEQRIIARGWFQWAEVKVPCFRSYDSMVQDRLVSGEEVKRLRLSGGDHVCKTPRHKDLYPCRGGIPPLTPDEVTAFRRQVLDWSVKDEARRIEWTYTFKNFAEAFTFVRKVAELAEAEGHHPDVSFGLGYATVSLQTKNSRICTKMTSSWPPTSRHCVSVLDSRFNL
jgi:4a-hydroxytetrahydrobiopterin dehydratase